MTDQDADLQNLYAASKADLRVSESFVVIRLQLADSAVQCPYLPVCAATAHVTADTAVLAQLLPAENLHFRSGRAGGFDPQTACDLTAYVHIPAAILFFYCFRCPFVYSQHFCGLPDTSIVCPLCLYHRLPPAVIKPGKIPVRIPAPAVKVLQELRLIACCLPCIGLGYFVFPGKGEAFLRTSAD